MLLDVVEYCVAVYALHGMLLNVVMDVVTFITWMLLYVVGCR